MNFRITGLAPESFADYFHLDADALAARGAQRVIADDPSSFPCRVSLAHALPGEELILRRTLAANGRQNVTCLNVACGSTAGMATLTDEPRKDDNNKVDESGAGIPVKVTALIDLLRDHSLAKVDLLKIDVEGFEYAVLSGLEGDLSMIGAMHIEVIEANLGRYGHSTAAIVSLLQRNGFACFEIIDDPTNLVAFSTAPQVSGWGVGLVGLPGNPVLD